MILFFAAFAAYAIILFFTAIATNAYETQVVTFDCNTGLQLGLSVQLRINAHVKIPDASAYATTPMVMFRGPGIKALRVVTNANSGYTTRIG